MLAGDTTKLKLTDMARKGILQVQDIWKYNRTFRGGITVTKELTVIRFTKLANIQCTGVDPETFSLTFSCPSGEDEYVRTGVQPIEIQGIENPTTLETRLLDEDARIKRLDRPNGNAYKTIRIIRGNEDIGSLFDVRMSAFDKQRHESTEGSRQ